MFKYDDANKKMAKALNTLKKKNVDVKIEGDMGFFTIGFTDD